jgi:hypothetical protein
VEFFVNNLFVSYDKGRHNAFDDPDKATSSPKLDSFLLNRYCCLFNIGKAHKNHETFIGGALSDFGVEVNGKEGSQFDSAKFFGKRGKNFSNMMNSIASEKKKNANRMKSTSGRG